MSRPPITYAIFGKNGELREMVKTRDPEEVRSYLREKKYPTPVSIAVVDPNDVATVRESLKQLERQQAAIAKQAAVLKRWLDEYKDPPLLEERATVRRPHR